MRIVSDIALQPVIALRANPHNARTHSKKQVRQIANSIEAFGFVNPLIADDSLELIAGHGRLQAAILLGLDQVPVIQLSDLTEREKRKLSIADNRIAENAGWDVGRLAAEFSELIVEGDDLTITGFEIPEIEQILLDTEQVSKDPADETPPLARQAVSQPGDLWILDDHRLLCGDARSLSDISNLCGSIQPAAMFTDPPYNRKMAEIVGKGRRKYEEFRMASGELSDEQFAAFLTETIGAAVAVSGQGAVHFICMDWRGIETLLKTCRPLYGEILNLVVWVKNNAGQGSFYKSQHELVAVARVGNKPHQNHVALGRYGRNRSNVWSFPGANSFRKGRLEELAMHPTVKPVAMIVEALRDCTKRGEAALDIFGGSGSTLMACQRIGRRALLLEIEPKYVDVTIERWQRFTRKDAIHEASGKTFDELKAEASMTKSQPVGENADA